MERRRFLEAAGGALAASLAPRPLLAQAPPAFAQSADSQALVKRATRGKEARVGKVKLDLPLLADNGNSVPMKVAVESPMTAADHVKTIRLLSERNPEWEMAAFHLGPYSGRAEITSRVRLAGSQRVVALAEMSDGSYWMGTADVTVTLSACVDGTG
ncbi:MAG TPA: SoxY-related AACIE arm protein [Burkholderiales bacterium]|nr:SoxY-related AACIE arm protein [Burkholderiales bacterium]